MVAVEKSPNIFRYLGKNLKDDDDILKLAFQQNEEIQDTKDKQHTKHKQDQKDLFDEDDYNKLKLCLKVKKS